MDTTTQSMFYKPRSKETGRMWDTWLYRHEGTYHLYYLAAAGEQWDNISMATSPDGVHWTEIGPVLRKGPGVTWMGTGSTWKSPRFEADGRFFMNFSEWKGPRQTIFFAASGDLVHWTRLGDELEFVQDERWYEREGRWDCIWTVPKPDGDGLFGYWTATPKPETGGRFGFGETRDGVTWRALRPPVVHGIGEGEVGAIENIAGRYYMMFGAGGMYTLVAERPEGPFRLAEKNALLLSGHTYFARFLPVGDAVLVNHHSIGRDGAVHVGLLKRAVVDDEGTFRLAWWDGNDGLKREPVDVGAPKAGPEPEDAAAMLDNVFDVERGLVLEGELLLPEGQAAPRRGLYVECEPGSGAAILLDANGAAELGPIRSDGGGFEAEMTEDREVTFSRPATFRLLLKGALLEFYLDDILVECFSLPQPATGRLGLFRGGDPASIRDLGAWHP